MRIDARQSRWNKRSGFTLIELMVTISIISLMVAILLPVIAKSRQAAQAIRCVANLQQLVTASLLYAGDYDQRIPPSYYEPPAGAPGVWLGWYDHLFVYLNRHGANRDARRFAQSERGHVMDCAMDAAGESRFASYSATAAVGTRREGVYLQHGEIYKYTSPVRVMNAPWSLSRVAWYADSKPGNYFRASGATDKANGFLLDWRHDIALNVAYMDGRVARTPSAGVDEDPNLIDGNPQWQTFFARP